jgi:parallel beta-helix repeat protein
VDVDGDSICADQDCDDTNPYCDVDCEDFDGDAICINWDCNDSVWSCGLDCTTNSDAAGEPIPMSDCMEIFCGSDPQDPNSSCIMPTTSDDLVDAINSLGDGDTHIIIGDIKVSEDLPAIDHDGSVTITQEPGTTITTDADRLFTIRGDDNHIEGLVIEIQDAKTVIDIQGDNNTVVGVSMITTDEQPDKAIDVSGSNNLIAENYIAGFDDRGIAIDGNNADDNVVRDNVITGGVDFSSNDKGGIFIRQASNTTIIGNVIAQNNMDGISIQRAEQTRILHNTIAYNANGLVFSGWGNNRRSSDTCARSNLITHHQWGAGVVSRSGTTWDESPDCLATSGYDNNTYENGSACDFSTCYGCSCLPSDSWWEHSDAPNYVATEREETGYYCLEDSNLEDLGRDLGYDLNGDQPGLYNGASPDIGARETGSSQCQ